MISEFSIRKALLDRLNSLPGLPEVFPEGSSGKPDPQDYYLQEHVLPTPTSSVGISNSSSDIQRGIYQIDINFPKAHGKFKALEYGDIIASGFPKGLQLTHGGQQVKISTTSWSPVRHSDLNSTVSLSIRYTVTG